MFNLNDLRFSNKITLLGVSSVLLTALALLSVVAWQSGQYNAVAQSKVAEVTDINLKNITQGIYNLVKAQGESVQQQVDYSLNVARSGLARTGQVSLSPESTNWTAVNQFTQEPVQVQLPKMLVGNAWLGNNTNLAAETPVVDEVTRLVGGTATIFQRMNAKGDMLRVATNVPTADGKRAIGTYIPAVNPDGTPNPVVAAVLKGEAYHGLAFVVNAWYLAAYEPIRDSSGNLTGMLYVGVKQESVLSLRQAILQTRVGKTGYVYTLGGRGDGRGHYVISPDGRRDGEDVWSTQDAEGGYSIQSIVARAVMLKPDEVTSWRYLWKERGEPAPRWKIVQIAYYEPWDWVLVAEVYEDELQEYQVALQNGRSRMIGVSGVIGLGVALAIGIVSFLISRSITRPLQHLTSTAGQIAAGDLTLAVKVKQKDEIGALAQAFNSMTAQLRELIMTLEQRVAGRTRELEQRSAQLEATAQVGRAVASILDPDQLIQQVVELVQEKFGLYYVGLFLSGETGEWAVLRAGTGDAGRAMLARGHQIRTGEGTVGWSIAHAEARVASKADQEAARLATPELPDSRSEVALPLRSRGQVIGALTVQSTQANAFDKDAVTILQTMADQVAAAFDNAHLFAQSQAALEAERRAYGEISREAWMQMAQANWGYRSDQQGVVASRGDWRPEMAQAVRNKQVALASDGTAPAVAIPLQVRDHVVGVLDFRKANENETWTEEEIALLKTLADQLGVALESARLYQDTQRRAAREQTINTVTARIRGVPTVNAILQRTVQELGRTFGASRASIRVEMSEPAGKA